MFLSDKIMSSKKIKVRKRVVIEIPSHEIYSKKKLAEFLLSNSVDRCDYKSAAYEVKKMGLNPKKVRHYKAKFD